METPSVLYTVCVLVFGVIGLAACIVAIYNTARNGWKA